MAFLRPCCCRLSLSSAIKAKGSENGVRIFAVRFKYAGSIGEAAKQSTLKFEPGGLSQTQLKVTMKNKTTYQKLASDFAKFLPGILMFGASWVTSFITLLPHTVQQESMQALYQHYTGGFPTKIPQDVRDLLEQVMEESKLTEAEVGKTKFFIGSSTDAFAWGGYSSRYGSRISLPEFITFDNARDVRLKEMRFGTNLSTDRDNKPHHLSNSQLELKETRQFVDNLLLSEKAKKFVVAREIERAKSYYCKLHAIITPINILLAYAVSKTGNRTLHLFRRPRKVRGLMYVLVGGVFAYVTVLQRDYFKRKFDSDFDERACQIGKGYAQGGVEFYEKAIQRNLALREIMPNGSGKETYNRRGEFYPSLFRFKYLTFAERRATCERLFAEYE